MEKEVPEVTSPRLLPKASNASAVYDWLSPAVMVAVSGEITNEAVGPALTVRVALSAWPLFVPVTVQVPAFSEV